MRKWKRGQLTCCTHVCVYTKSSPKIDSASQKRDDEEERRKKSVQITIQMNLRCASSRLDVRSITSIAHFLPCQKRLLLIFGRHIQNNNKIVAAILAVYLVCVYIPFLWFMLHPVFMWYQQITFCKINGPFEDNLWMFRVKIGWVQF